MDNITVKFTAKGQALRNVEGVIELASDTVGYALAEFDLDGKWDGYDMVTAVWTNGPIHKTKILAESACEIPPEVFTRIGLITVNLIAVKLEGGSVTRRFTSYPAGAINNKVKVQLVGDETAPVTESQFEQFVQIVGENANKAYNERVIVEGLASEVEANALAASNSAEAAAQAEANAESHANAASLSEDAAGNSERLADSYATEAREACATAVNAATSASESATSASASATSASASAATASTDADRAEAAITQVSADAARAETAAGNAQTYASNASQSAASASNSASDAEEAKDLAEDYRDAAQGYSQSAYNSSVQAQASEANAESYKNSASSSATSASESASSASESAGEASDARDDVLAFAENYEKVLPTDTASGSIATFPDGTSLFPAKAVKVSLEPIQDLHGFDKPWSGGAGVNKYDQEWESASLDASNGVLVSYPNRIASKNYIPCLPNTQYYIYSGSDYGLCRVCYYKSDKTFISTFDQIAWNRVITTPADAQYMRFCNLSKDVTAYNNDISINNPSSVTTFVPYENICPISGRTGCEVDVSGINMFDKDAQDASRGFAQGRYLLNNGNEQNPSTPSEWNISEYISVKPNTQYILSGLPTSGANVPSLCQYDAGKNFLTGLNYLNSARRAITTQATTAYIRISIPTANASEIQVELGSTATDYSPYHGNTYPVSWQTEAGTVYGGTLDAVSGVLTVTHEIITLDGTQTLGGANWQTKENSTAWWYPYSLTNHAFTTNLTDPQPLMSDSEEVISSYAAIYGTKMGVSCYNSSGIGLIVRTSDMSLITASAVNAYLAQHPIQVVYELATPQTYQLTPTEIALLDGTNNVWSDGGDVEVTYKADIEKYIEKKLG